MERMIEVNNLVKNFKVAKRDKGFLGNLLSRQYDTKLAVDGISFNVSKGELVGYIGPNGAGKSTTIKMLSGILVPTSGDISVLGNVPYVKRKENALNIGVVFGQRTQLWWDLPIKDSFDLLRRIYKIPNDVYKANYDEFSDILELDKFINMPVRQLSLGQRIRADLAASLLHNPQIIFLDEPTIGLDVVVKKKIREFIKKIRNEREATVILTTHDMKDIQEICERIIMIDNGKVVLDMKVEDVKNKLGCANLLVVDFACEPGEMCIPEATIESKDGNKWTFAFKKNEISANELIIRIGSQASVSNIELKEPDIEDVIRDIYTGQIVI